MLVGDWSWVSRHRENGPGWSKVIGPVADEEDILAGLEGQVWISREVAVGLVQIPPWNGGVEQGQVAFFGKALRWE